MFRIQLMDNFFQRTLQRRPSKEAVTQKKAKGIKPRRRKKDPNEPTKYVFVGRFFFLFRSQNFFMLLCFLQACLCICPLFPRYTSDHQRNQTRRQLWRSVQNCRSNVGWSWCRPKNGAFSPLSHYHKIRQNSVEWEQTLAIYSYILSRSSASSGDFLFVQVYKKLFRLICQICWLFAVTCSKFLFSAETFKFYYGGCFFINIPF